MTLPAVLIDGAGVVASGSLLDAVLAAGIDLPHLCKDDNLPPIGACRTCLVEADGRIVASCSVPAASVKEVNTSSERAIRLRGAVLALTAAMIAPGPGGGGPLGGTARATIEAHPVAGAVFARSTGESVDTTNPFFSFHEEECILCARCVTACQALQHISAIGMSGRARETRVTPGAGATFRDSICTSCGSCVAACPTTALRPKMELSP